ncbi:hypothetical protein F5890DRAFT_1553361 [Lentinula detonsa]|uniref:Uncharacterized protein n=1 Tax=Lentinula detonsa TaxID=2804962 RepID=A0AA38Q1V9_9AGAR|nr:hypothetical protein F5890DRAFT_1553361 [Lentinula detonsa]
MNIEQAWRKSGIKPFNPDIFTDKDFAPSIPSSTQARFPESFPTRLLQAPDASSDDALFDPYELDRREGRERRERMVRETKEVMVTVKSQKQTWGSIKKLLFHAFIAHAFTSFFPKNMVSNLSAIISAHSFFISPNDSNFLFLDKELEWLCAENARLRADNAGLKEESASLKAQHDAAQAHAVFAGQQYAVYKHRLHEKTKKKEASKQVSTSARVLTLMQGRLEIAADAAKKAMKSQELQKKKEKDAQKAREDIVCRAEQEKEHTEFFGNMKYMGRSTLVDIAFSLNMETEQVTIEMLHVCLNAHFEANPELKKHPRYLCLFERSRSQKRKEPPTESNTPQHQPSPTSTSHSSPAPGPSSHYHPPPAPAPGPSSLPNFYQSSNPFAYENPSPLLFQHMHPYPHVPAFPYPMFQSHSPAVFHPHSQSHHIPSHTSTSPLDTLEHS